tara:strand:- start:948 stop:1562 length:615 start_codon:yes stop_codon:yes gene_type:complete
MQEVEHILIFLVAGYLIRLSLIFAGQAWAKSYAQTISFYLLPMITYVITKVITGNIALSLGMIGALSIVRFRHPVKSPLELIIYFYLIALGISTSVSTRWSIQLILFTTILIFSFKLIQIFYKSKNKAFYNLSFNEGSTLNSLEVESSSKILLLEESKNINRINYDKETGFSYLLVFENKKNLLDFKKKLEKDNSVKQITTNFV